jgi:hypothetical protein
MKVCSSCEEKKPLEDFHKDSRGKEGRRASCKECDLSKKKQKYSLDTDYKEKVRKYQRDRSEHYRDLNKVWYKENREYVREKVRHRYHTIAETRASIKANSAQYRRSKISAQPSWLSDADKQRIKDIYLLAEDLQLVSGQKYQVDHIIPLRGKKVCGLHVPWNLQVLPEDINLSKGNAHEDSW